MSRMHKGLSGSGSTTIYDRGRMPLPASFAHLKRRISDRKWPEVVNCSRQRLNAAVDKPRSKQRVDSLPAKTDKSTYMLHTASRFYIHIRLS